MSLSLELNVPQELTRVCVWTRKHRIHMWHFAFSDEGLEVGHGLRRPGDFEAGVNLSFGRDLARNGLGTPSGGRAGVWRTMAGD